MFRTLIDRYPSRITLFTTLGGAIVGILVSAWLVPDLVSHYYYRADGSLSTYPGGGSFKLIHVDPNTGEKTLSDPPGQRSLTAYERRSQIVEDSIPLILGGTFIGLTIGVVICGGIRRWYARVADRSIDPEALNYDDHKIGDSRSHESRSSLM